MGRSISSLAVLLLWPTACVAQSASTAGFSGLVTTQDGTPLAGVGIVFQRMPVLTRTQFGSALAPGEVYHSAVATSDGTGAFSLSGIPPGTYNYCAYLDGYLDPCRWAYGPTAQAQAGATTSLPILALAEGIVIAVTIQDPNSLLSNYNIVNPGFALGVFRQSGAFQNAVLVARSTGSFTFHITVPSEETLDFWLHSRYTILDQNGAPISAQGLRQPLQQGAAVSLVFTIAGVL